MKRPFQPLLKTARVATGIVALMGAASCGLIAGVKDRSLEDVADAVAADARPLDAQVADTSAADTSALDVQVAETSAADAQVADTSAADTSALDVQVFETSALDVHVLDTSADSNETSGLMVPDGGQGAPDTSCTPPGQGAACQTDPDCAFCGGQFPTCGASGCVTMCAFPNQPCSSQGDCCIGYSCDGVSLCTAANCSRSTCLAQVDCCVGTVCNGEGICVGTCGPVMSTCINNASCCIGSLCQADDAGDLVCQ